MYMNTTTTPETEFAKAYSGIVQQLTDEELLYEIGQVIIRKDDFHVEALQILNQQFLTRGNTK